MVPPILEKGQTFKMAKKPGKQDKMDKILSFLAKPVVP